MYKDPIIAKVIEMFEQNGPSTLSGKWHHGDLLMPEQSDLPLGYVTKDQTLMQPATTMENEHLQLMVATVIFDATDDLDASYGMVAGMSDLFELMEGRYAFDDPNPAKRYMLKPDTLLYQARNSQQIDTNMWIGVGTPVQINYGLGVGRRGPGMFSVEANMRFTVRLHLDKPGLTPGL